MNARQKLEAPGQGSFGVGKQNVVVKGEDEDEEFSGLVIRYDLMRLNKPLAEITAGDVPPGFDPEDVASDFSD